MSERDPSGRSRWRKWCSALTVIAGLFLISACTSTSTARIPTPPAGRTATPSPLSAVSAPPLASTDKYAVAIRDAVARGMQVWVETDLVKRWGEGPTSYALALARVEQLGRLPGVVGVKIADELGYHDQFRSDPTAMRTFLATTSKALRSADPHLKILIDLVVPELGCAPGLPSVASPSAACTAQAAAAYPALDLAALDSVLRDHSVDVVDLSTSLLDDATYQSWGIDTATAQRAAWAEVQRRGWFSLVTLNARKALAHPGSYAGTPATSATDMEVYVDIPRAAGAKAVDIWTWRQLYQGQTYQLMNPGLTPNALWDALVAERAQGAELITHFSPSSVDVSTTVDLGKVASVFGTVFMAAGTG